jgi:NAD(P)-dependent dehydrogenase (short-subunit alcohol dehydrogenase family)
MWTFDDISPQNGRTAIVTGANSGLGYQIAIMLARRGAKVILACRSLENAKGAAVTMRETHPDENLNVTAIESLDLSDLKSIEKFARTVYERYSSIDLLINNAGVMVPPLERTRQGFELQFGVNHLGHFALTGQLLPLMSDMEGARIVSMSSIAAWMDGLNLDDPNYERRRYRKWFAYGASKLANQIFIRELSRRLTEAGSKAIAVAAHPGVSSTSLFKHSALGGWYARRFSQSPEQGALPALRAATDPTVKNGDYWGPGGFLEFAGYPEPARIPPKALDRDLCTRLWSLSESLTEVSYL